MAGDTPIHVIGNLVSDPELRFTPAGHAVANIAVATTPRRFDKERQEWVDKEAMFLRGSVWRDYAENVMETLKKGDRVIVVGNLIQRSYETREGEKRYIIELEIDEIGPALRYASGKITKNVKKGTNNAVGGPSSEDPWGDVPPPNGPDDEPPF